MGRPASRLLKALRWEMGVYVHVEELGQRNGVGGRTLTFALCKRRLRT